ncbi:hypothetical protein ACQEVS_09795 [Streptomyces sp. CA-181903]|uniref:hypothetical protein n=1 Tax=Streptomyces sp. CA-181903 TaxID=3240055 RepID=UPI003D900ED5
MTDSYAVADADPVATVLSWLTEHPEATKALGGPGRVSGIVEGPWPHLRVTAGAGGDLRDLSWATEPEVALEIYGDPGGWPGPAALRRALLVCAVAAAELPRAPQDARRPVVSRVRPSGMLIDSPLVTGQPRYILGLLITLRPPEGSTRR